MSLKNWVLAIFLALFAGLLIFISSDSEATYTILRDASNLSRGTLPNARLDPSSVTLQGNNITLNPSSTTLQGNAFNGANQLLQLNSSGLSPNANIDPSSVTKLGNGLLPNVNIDPSSITKLGNGLLPNANIDTSSVTKQGNTFNLNPSSVTFQGNTFNLNPSSVTFQGNTFNGANQLIKTDANSLISNLNVDPSSVTKLGQGPFLSSGSASVNSFHLNVTGVGAASYGTVTQSPQITISADGRITAASNVDIMPQGLSKLYSAIIGTTSARNPTSIGTTDAQFTAAVSSMGGTTYAGGTIFVTNGDYTIANTTIPAGLELICESSATFKNDTSGNINRNMFFVYGTIRGCTFDISEVQSPYTPSIVMKSGGRLLKNNFHSLNLNVAQAGSFHRPIDISSAVNVEVSDNQFQNLNLTGAAVLARLINIESSTNVFLNRNYFPLSASFKGGNPLIYMRGGTNINITDNWGYTAGTFVYQDGTANFYPYLTTGLNVSNNRLMVAGALFGSNSVFNLAGTASSGTVVNNNYFEMFTEAAINIVNIGSVGAYSSPVISNNVVTATDGAATSTFVKIYDVNVRGAVIRGNHVVGLSAFINDSGTGTQYTTLGNFMGNVQQ